METNDETMIISGRAVNQPQKKEDNTIGKKKSSAGKVVAGAAAGVAVGAGAMYAANVFSEEAKAQVSDDKANEKPVNKQPENTDDDVKVADANEVTSSQDPTIHPTLQTNADDVQVAPAHSQDVDVVDDSNYVEASNESDAGDVHVVGQGYIEGHMAATLDLTGNGEADVAVIDVNDNGQLDDPDVVVDSDGNYATMGDLVQAQDGVGTDDGYRYTGDNVDPTADPSLQQTAYENPDLSPDMPDYMDNADVSFT